jgi:hypothetical protein
MEKKIVKLTETDLINIVKRVIQEEQVNKVPSTKGSLIDIAKKDFSHKNEFPQEYKWMLNPDYVWDISNSRGVKVGGVSNPTKGKQFKSKDFVEIISNDGELFFVPKGNLSKLKKGRSVVFGVNLGPEGSIRINAYWN